MSHKRRIYGLITLCTILCVFLVPVSAVTEAGIGSIVKPAPSTPGVAGISPGNRYPWSDLQLNASAGNPWYNGTGWIVNESGHIWRLDLNAVNNTGPGVTLNGNIFSNFGPAFAILINAPNVIFDGMGAVLDGGGVTEYGIVVNNQNAGYPAGSYPGPLKGISITNITLIGFTKAGILFNNVIGTLPGAGTSSGISDVVARDNNPSGGGTGIELENSQHITLKNNRADGNRNGIVLLSADNNTLSGNTANGNYGNAAGSAGYGFHLTGSDFNTLANNTAGMNDEGFCLDRSHGNTLAGNVAVSNNYSGFFFNRADLNTLVGNTASGNYHEGFNLTNSEFNTIAENTAAGNHDGMRLYSSANNTLMANNATGSFDDGIRLYFSSDNNITANNVTGNNNDGIRLYFSWSNNIIGNTATGNRNDGIRLYFSANNTVAANNAARNHGNGIRLYFSEGNSIIANDATENHDDGTWLLFSDSNNLTNNRFTSNGGAGLALMWASDNLISNNYFDNTNNTQMDVMSTGNTWTVPPAPGTNIVGGPNLGGNYWATPSGTGWSQTHPDIGGGFTVPYDTSGNLRDIDWHPLTMNRMEPVVPLLSSGVRL